MSLEPAPFEHLLEVLNRHGVRYVVIGAFAAIAQGAPLGATCDIDFTPSRTAENLTRLSSALRELDAHIRVADIPEGLAFSHDADFLANVDMLNLVSSDGAFDLVFKPAAMPAGFEDLAPHAVEIHIGNQVAQAAGLSDVIRSKEEAGREKDGSPELPDLLAELLQLGPLFGGEARSLAALDLGLGHPGPQRLVADPELSGHPADHAVALSGLGDGLEDHPDGPLLRLRRVPLLGSLVRWHGTIHSKRKGLHADQGGSSSSRSTTACAHRPKRTVGRV